MPLIFPSQRSELEGGEEEKSVEEKSVEGESVEADKSEEEDKAAEPREEKVEEDEDLAKLWFLAQDQVACVFWLLSFVLVAPIAINGGLRNARIILDGG